MATTGPNLGLIEFATQGVVWYTEQNALERGLDGLVQPVAIDKDLTAPPGSPTNGQVYIVAGSPTGAWSGQAGKIARYQNSDTVSTTAGWEFYTPKEGWLFYLQDENLLYRYDGSAWGSLLALYAPLASPALTGVPTVPTAAPGTNTTQAASTAFVTTAVGAGGVVTSVFARTGAVVAVAGDYDATKGGTGQTSYATGDTLYASATNTLAKRTIGSTGNVLTVAGGIPTWAAPTGLQLGTTALADTAGGASDRTQQIYITKTQTTDSTNANEVVNPLYINFVKSANSTTTPMGAATFVVSTDGSPGSGNLHGISVTNNFSDDNTDEATAIYSSLVGTGTGRLWGQDAAVLGPTAAQANMVVGHSLFVANQFNSSPTKKSIGLHITSGRRAEGPATADTYANDYGIVIDGICGANPGGTTKAWTVGIGIGIGSVGGWAISGARVGSGMFIQNFDTVGIEFGGSYTGSPPYMRRDTVFQLDYNGNLILGTSTANANTTIGLTLNQGAADDEILCLKSSDVAHGMTTITETDTYGLFKKLSGANGALLIEGFSDGTIAQAIQLTPCTAVATTTKSTAATAALVVSPSLKSGTGVTSLGANANIAAFQDNGTTRFILDADGDSHQDVGTAWTNFDSHDDVALLNRLSAQVTRRDDPLRASFGHWLTEAREDLERLELVAFEEDGHPFVNMSRLQMLTVGAVRQLGARIDEIETRLLTA